MLSMCAYVVRYNACQWSAYNAITRPNNLGSTFIYHEEFTIQVTTQRTLKSRFCLYTYTYRCTQQLFLYVIKFDLLISLQNSVQATQDFREIKYTSIKANLMHTTVLSTK